MRPIVAGRRIARLSDGRPRSSRAIRGKPSRLGRSSTASQTSHAAFSRIQVFVTRMKDRTVYRVLERREVPANGPVISDEVIVLDSIRGRTVCPHRLRRVCVWDEANQRELVLLSNQLTFAAGTIGRIYKERWQIELFFKALKQNLKVKTFVGTSENAVRIQIYTALIAMLLLKMLQLRSSFGWSLSNLAAMIRFNLLTYRHLWRWLDEPFTPPEDLPPEEWPLLANCSMLSLGGT